MLSFSSSFSRGATVSLCAGSEGKVTFFAAISSLRTLRSSLFVMSKKLMFCCSCQHVCWLYSASLVSDEAHTRRKAHFSSSVTHRVSPGDSSIRYWSGSSIVTWGFWSTICGSFGVATAAARATADRDSNTDDFIIASAWDCRRDGCCCHEDAWNCRGDAAIR